MNQKEGVIKRACFISLVIFSILGLTVYVGCSGGGGGGGAGAPPQTFTTSNFFPLTSGWETDRWTLFVDVAEHDLNGVMTKAMADTRGPGVLYWTNTNGLRLHGKLDEEGTLTVFDPPIIFAGITTKVGDMREGTFTIEKKEYAYEIELAGVEDVSVPAGDFEDCLKFSIFVYPTSELPSLYGFETFWLAEDVGFVKAIADTNAGSSFFTGKGETRRLLSYHITPSNLSGDELAIHEWFKRMNELTMAEDLVGTMAMISDDYLDRRCRDKATAEIQWGNLFDNNSDWIKLVSIEDIEINGDEAFVLREYLGTSVNDDSGEREWSWNRELRRLKKDNGEWKYYGAHLGFRPDWYDVYVGHTSDDGEIYGIGADFIDCADNQYIDTTDPISIFAISGPSGSGLVDVDLLPYWDDTDPSGRLGFRNTESLMVGVSGSYTFRVENQTGDYFVYTDYLEAAPHMALAVLVSPTDGEAVSVGNVTLDWDPVGQAETYEVNMEDSDDGGTTWNIKPNIYTDDTQTTVSVNPETRYRWQVRAQQYDVYGERDGESRSAWKEFAARDDQDDAFTINGFLQYRTYSDTGRNHYGGLLAFTKNNSPIDQSDITEIILKDSAGSPVSISGTYFWAASKLWGNWNDSTSSVDFSGPFSDAGFSIRFPDETNLSAGDYIYEATTSSGDRLALTKYFPGEMPLSPVVDVASMSYQWLGNGDLHLTWAVPIGTFDQYWIMLEDQDFDDLLYVRLPPDNKGELTVPSEWIQKITDLYNPSSANWKVMTRSYTTTADHNNYARGYSDNVKIPWRGDGG